MADTTEREFWRDLKPIEEVFRPGAGADVYISDAATDDELPPWETDDSHKRD